MLLLHLFLAGLLAPSMFPSAELDFPTDRMTDDELRAYRDSRVQELKETATRYSPEKTPDGPLYEIFYCTIYYTPKESGFTAEKGFDDTPTSAPGLGKHKYPADFLKAVKKEGFGRLVEPVKDKAYIRYSGSGRYAFAKQALGNRGNVLEPRRSAAISTKNKHLRQRMKLLIDSPELRAVMGTTEWEICDVGGGVHPLQIDLYWGEDEPQGAIGRQRARPAGTKMEYAFDVHVTVQKQP